MPPYRVRTEKRKGAFRKATLLKNIKRGLNIPVPQVIITEKNYWKLNCFFCCRRVQWCSTRLHVSFTLVFLFANNIPETLEALTLLLADNVKMVTHRAQNRDLLKSDFIQLYGILVCPHLEYGMPVCSLKVVTEVSHLERNKDSHKIGYCHGTRHLP